MSYLENINFLSFLPFLKSIFLFVLFYLVAKVVSQKIFAILGKTTDTKTAGIIKNILFYSVMLLGIFLSLNQVGIDVKVLVGAAGILTVAIGFASQTSTANIISGLFLLLEKRFGISDVIEINNIRGEVISIGLLSTELRTLDNLSVRVPNELLMKSNVRNYTRFKLRRVDLLFRFKSEVDFLELEGIFFGVVKKNPLCFDEPIPQVIFNNMSEIGIEVQFSVWCKREDFLEVKKFLITEIFKAMNANSIDISFSNNLYLNRS